LGHVLILLFRRVSKSVPCLRSASIGPSLAATTLEPSAPVRDFEDPLGHEHLEPLGRGGLLHLEQVRHAVTRKEELVSTVFALELPTKGDEQTYAVVSAASPRLVDR
jgi:hypothetical protein